MSTTDNSSACVQACLTLVQRMAREEQDTDKPARDKLAWHMIATDAWGDLVEALAEAEGFTTELGLAPYLMCASDVLAARKRAQDKSKAHV